MLITTKPFTGAFDASWTDSFSIGLSITTTEPQGLEQYARDKRVLVIHTYTPKGKKKTALEGSHCLPQKFVVWLEGTPFSVALFSS